MESNTRFHGVRHKVSGLLNREVGENCRRGVWGKGGRGGAPGGRVPTRTEGNIERANETVVRA